MAANFLLDLTLLTRSPQFAPDELFVNDKNYNDKKEIIEYIMKQTIPF